MSSLYGSICLSDIPRSQMKKDYVQGWQGAYIPEHLCGGKERTFNLWRQDVYPLRFLFPKKRNARTVRITSLEIFKPTSRNRTPPPLPNRWPQPQAYHLLTTCLSDSL